ncbi:MAG TPA: ABC transporter permease [Gemmatimonadales bacterium]
MTNDRGVRWPERAYAALLWLYPAPFRRRFATDMRELFVDRCRAERLRSGRRGVARLWWRLMADAVTAAGHEHAADLRERFTSRVATLPNPPRPATGDPMFETMLHDLRYTGRMLRKSPAFTIIAMLVIALGSGAVTTIFSAASALLFRPLPGARDPGRLVDIARTDTDHSRSYITPSYPFYTHLRDESHQLHGVAAWTFIQLTVSTGAQGTTTFGNLVSANYFSVIGVRPALGRFFTPDEDRNPGAHPVVVLSDGFWRGRFNADPAIVGKQVLVNSAPYIVIGVAPPKFSGVFPIVRTDAWVPLTMAPLLQHDATALTDPGAGWLRIIGRLADGVTIPQARSELATIAVAHAAEEPADFREFRGIAISRITGFPADASGAIMAFALLLLVISGMVLVIASVNVAGMLLARATTRRREMALRIALGAGRARLIRQMLTESIVLFVGGAAGGLLIAVFATRLFARIQLPAEVPIRADVAPDYRVLAFALGLALITGVVFGLAPALEATRHDPSVGLRSESAGSGTRRTGLRNALVVGQLAISLLLLMSAGLFVRALNRGQQIPAGFEIAHVATAPIDVSTSGYLEPRARLFFDALKQRLLRAPGVAAVSYARWVPLTGSSMGTRFRIDGRAPAPGDRPDNMVDVSLGVVAPDYFAVMQMPLVRGRGFRDADNATAPMVAVVNEAFARKYWPGRDPIGQTFHDQQNQITVVGVARDAKYFTLNEALQPFVFLNLLQDWAPSANLFVRTTGDAATLAPIIRDAVRDADPLLPSPAVVTMAVATQVGLLPQRIAAAVTGVMGVLGLILAVVGLYGVVSFTVSQRTREIGVRMALGADRATVLRMVLRDGMRLVVIGIVVGLVLAVGATRVMSRFLYGVSPLDPYVFAVIPIGLAAATLIASYLPARRAASTDPLAALRE